MKKIFGACRTVTAAMALVAVSSATSLAETSADLTELRKMGQCSGCIFESIDLTGKNLTGVNLAQSRLTTVDFGAAELGIAIFDFAILENVSFEGADLGGASFRGAQLVNVSFEGADLQGAVFEDASLNETDLNAGVLCNTQMPEENTDNSECN